MTTVDRAREWAAHDPDPLTAKEVEAWLTAGDDAALASAFAGPLLFGTAGLRAPVGAGESRLNRAVIRRTTYGLMTWLRAQIDADPVVVVGCDARHGSAAFQQDAAEVISALGGTALVLPAQLPTPLTAFTVRHLHADAGIMVTASHNPPADNGYKVYLGGRVATGPAEGVQLIAPADGEIAAAIAAAPWADEIVLDDSKVQRVDTREEYLARALTLSGAHTDVSIALTAMHGVGASLGAELLQRAGFSVNLVPEQAEPDPDFPTVAFPNPEEKGALDLAKSHAEKINADVVIAYDPDADRCACAIPTDEGWLQLSGDELGALLGDYLASRGAHGTFANSIVSSRLLASIAASYGLPHVTTLTGFKWIARTPDLAFGYEEAIGYCCDPKAVADKDGISASIVLASLVGELKAEGKTLADRLDEIAHTHGLYLTSPLTFRVSDLALIARGMQILRTHPPQELAGAAVTEVIDLADGTLPCGATDGMYFLTADHSRVIVRPSGTEPKLKCYLEVLLPVGEGQEVPRAAARERLDTIAADLTELLGF